MKSSAVLRVYTVAASLVCAGAVVFTVEARTEESSQASTAAAWQHQAQQWQDIARRTLTHDQQTLAANRLLVARYNRLVATSRLSQARLFIAVRQARAAAERNVPTQYVSSGTVYQTVSGGGGGGGGAAAAAPAAPASVASSAPTTHTS
jgi:hypothetical protein